MSTIITQTLLGQYRVDDFIASGGMGAVYRVWDLKRNVYLAMKVLLADLADDPSVYKRFQREAEALKKLKHPNIVPFYGLFKTSEFSFLLEHFIDGLTLKQILRQTKKVLSIEESLIYLKALSAALGYAHSHGVVHCDVKPGNVMIDRGGTIFLTDFGLVRHAESMVTTLGYAGTAAYMAPEQCRGEAVTAATDIYALGVILYELMTGRRPFLGGEEGTESAGTSTAERIRYEHMHLPAPDPKEYNPKIPEGLAKAVLKALNKKPKDRYGSAQEFYQCVCKSVGFQPSDLLDRMRAPSKYFPKWEQETGEAKGISSVHTKETAFPSIHLRRQNWQIVVGVGCVLVALMIYGVIRMISTTGNSRISSTATSASKTMMAQSFEETLAAEIKNSPSKTPRPTQKPTVTIMPTSTPRPLFTNISFCDKPCDDPGARTIYSAPEQVKEIYLTWEYSGMHSGVRYSRIWTMYGEEWVHYECIWRGPESGTFNLRLYDMSGLRSGPWIVTLYIEGEQVAQGSILVAGDYDYWDPVGYLPCPDFD